MNHPNHEEWLPFLDGEASPEAAKRLSEHLTACPQCAAEMEGRRRSIQKLRRLAWPPPQHAERSWLKPAVKWGIAAALVLGTGFGLGRLSSPSVREIESDVSARVRGELRQELRADLLAAFAQDPQSAKDGFRRQLALEIRQASAMGRIEDRQAMAGFLNGLQQKQATDYLSLRKDLETLASTADDRLQQTRWQMVQMAANASPMNIKP
jgi:hypothetical protein